MICDGRVWPRARPRRAWYRGRSQVHRDAVLAWNTCADAIDGWPKARLAVPRYRKNLSVTSADLPASFVADLEAYLARRLEGDLLAIDDVQAARPTTVRNEKTLCCCSWLRSGRRQVATCRPSRA